MGTCISIRQVDPPPYVSETRRRARSTHYTIHCSEHFEYSHTYLKTWHELKCMPCFICGNKNVELHPFYCERAGQYAIDWIAFGEFAKTCYNIQTGELINNYEWTEVSKNPELFVDSPHNMITLCSLHHTSENRGIHHVPFPDWILQKWARPDFDFLL
jgi:hypothetical protein